MPTTNHHHYSPVGEASACCSHRTKGLPTPNSTPSAEMDSAPASANAGMHLHASPMGSEIGQIEPGNCPKCRTEPESKVPVVIKSAAYDCAWDHCGVRV